jgi:hypothetical protein
MNSEEQLKVVASLWLVHKEIIQNVSVQVMGTRGYLENQILKCST